MGDFAGDNRPADRGEHFLDAAWTEAISATELLRSALDALGLAEEYPRLRGDVNVYGRPMVTVGRIAPSAARRLAKILALALSDPPAPSVPGAACSHHGPVSRSDSAGPGEVWGKSRRLPA